MLDKIYLRMNNFSKKGKWITHVPKIKIFDDHYDLVEFKEINTMKNLDLIKNFDIIIYNYSKNKTIQILKSFLKKK